MKKIIFLVIDGAGDRPVKRFKGRTPIEAASTPNMDKLAREGVCGSMHIIGKGIVPESDNAHLTLFGYDLKKYYPGRGPIEALGINVQLKQGDVAWRANLGTVDKNLRVKDRRAGRIKSTRVFCRLFDGMVIDGVKFIVKPGLEHRLAIIMRGKNLSNKITNNDPHMPGRKVLKVKPLDKSRAAKHTAVVFNKFLAKSHKILEKSKLNKNRKLAGNMFLCRGAGHYKKMPSFWQMYRRKACCIAGAPLYKGLGAVAGMKLINVKGATGTPQTNLKAKFTAAKNALRKYNFIFLHIKGTDIFGHDGKPVEKKKFLEKIDRNLKVLMSKDVVIAITPDHATPCEAMDHAADAVPFLISGRNIKPDSCQKYGERECIKGRYGLTNGKSFMNKVMILSK